MALSHSCLQQEAGLLLSGVSKGDVQVKTFGLNKGARGSFIQNET